MAFSFITHAEAGSTNNHSVTTASIDTTGADIIVINVGWYGSGTTPTVTDSKSNSWTSLTSRVDANIGCRIWYKASPTVGSGHTFTATGLGSYPNIQVLAFSGAHATPFDVENGGTGTGSTKQPGSITPAEGNELVIAGLGHENNSGGAVSIDGSYTAYTVAYSVGNCEGGGIAYWIQGSATATNPTWNITNSAAIAAAIAAFKSAAGGGGGGVGGSPLLNRVLSPGHIFGGKCLC